MQQRPKKISLRVEVSSTPSHTLGRGGEDDDDDDDEQRRRIGGANRRTRTIDSLSERDVMSMSLGEESGGGASDEATFMSPPPVSSDSRSAERRRSGVMATTPSMMMTTPTSQKASSSPDLDQLSVERQSGRGSPRLYYGGASKRPRYSNDWVEDEVHPSKVFFGSVMASSMAKAFVCNTTISSPEGDQISQCAATTGDSPWSFGGAAPLHHSQSDLPSLLRRTLSGTYDDHHHNQQYESGRVMGGGSGDAATASRGASSSAVGIPAPGIMVVPATNGGVISRDDFASAAYYHQQNGGGLPPSSPSDPSPLLDLRKAALMRSSSQNRRFANPSKNNVATTSENAAISARAGVQAGLPPRWRAQCPPGANPPAMSEGGIHGDEPPKRRDGHGGASAPHKEGSESRRC